MANHVTRYLNLTITADRVEVLNALRKNRETHAQEVAEARIGYVERAKKALAAKLDELASGKLSRLAFDLHMPLDMTEAYDTAIHMLELHKEATLSLDATQVQSFMEDKWDWTTEFLAVNSRYSDTVATKFAR